MLRSIIFLFISFLISLPTSARDSCEWPFRTQLKFSGNITASNQVKVVINSNSLNSNYDWSEDGRDLRVFEQDDFSSVEPQTELSFWIDSWDATNKTATIWIKTQDNSTNPSLYLFYGNSEAPKKANTPLTFTQPGIRFHTRNSTANPRNLVAARSAFNASNDNNINYGCSYITDFTRITNRSQLRTGSSSVYRTASINFGAFSESYFEANESGIWQFRYGADFGRGGGLYVDGKILEEQWTDDLWWANNWGTGTRTDNDNEILRGSIDLSTGYHKLEVLGFEGGNDGGITVQFKRPSAPADYASGWETFTTGNIPIHSRSCQMEEPTYTFSDDGVCEIDFKHKDNTPLPPEAWVVNSPRPVEFTIMNQRPSTISIPDTRLAITLTQRIKYVGYSGNDWTCGTPPDASGGSFECRYSAILTGSQDASLLTLNIQATAVSAQNESLTAVIIPRQFDTDKNNNTKIITLPTWELQAALSSEDTCSSSGVFTRIFDTSTYSDNLVGSNGEFDQWQAERAQYSNLYGQTILTQINNEGNPFSLTNTEKYFSILEANITIAEDGFYGFAVDGDDAIELKINGDVISAWYNGHAKNTEENFEGTVGLAKGQHRIVYRHQENTGQDSFYAYWREPGNSIEIIPPTAFSHCQDAADIQLSMSIEMQDIAAIPGSNDKAIPGAVLRYTLKGENKSVISSSPDSVVITQKISDNLSLFVESLALGVPNTSPIAFIDSTGIESSGLSYGVLSYSKDNGENFDYIPSAANTDTDGYNEEITDFKLTLNGSMLPKDTSAGTIPNFDIIYQVKVK
jgi:hypothetical protein